MARRTHLEAVDEHATVTQLELFFDLVFVFALTQTTALIAGDLTWQGALRGVLLLGLLWWSWVGYAWLGNVVRADEGWARATLLAAMAAMFLLALAIPEAFDDREGGLPGPLLVAVCYLFFRLLHLLLFWIAAGDDSGLRAQLLRFLPSVLGGTLLLTLAARTTGALQTGLWVAALAADYLGTFIGGARGWRLRSAHHFAERHGLIVIVALGESIVAIGVGTAGLPMSWPVVAAALLGLTVSAALWWSYFDVTALRTTRAIAAVDPADRPRAARDAYSFLHLPLIAGITLLAVGLKKVLEYVGDTEHHTLADPLDPIALTLLFGGTALYLLGHAGFQRRLLGSARLSGAVAGVVLVVAVPLLTAVPALAALALLVAVVLAVVAVEVVREDRYAVRHEEAA